MALYIANVFLSPNDVNISRMMSEPNDPPEWTISDASNVRDAEQIPSELPATTIPVVNALYFKNHCAGRAT